MPKRSIEKGIQGALSVGAYGAMQGHQLRKKYGKKATGIGAGVGSAVGFASGYLSGVPDPEMGANIYDDVKQSVRSQTMRTARRASDQIGADIANIYARRKINNSPLAGGVEAANRGQIYSRAMESLIPFENDLEMREASDRLLAKRVGEYEKRQGWQDALLALGASGQQLISDIMAQHERDTADADADYDEKMAKVLPSDFGSWSATEQAGYLAQKGLNVPEGWAELSGSDRMNYMRRVFQMSAMGPMGASADVEPGDPNWERDKDRSDRRRDGRWDVPDTDAMRGYPGVGKPDPGQMAYGAADRARQIVERERARNRVYANPDDPLPPEVPLSPEQRAGMPGARTVEITPPIGEKPRPGYVDEAEAPPIATDRPLIRSRKSSPIAGSPESSTPSRAPGSAGVTSVWEGLRNEAEGQPTRMPPVAVEADRPPTGRQSMTPPDGYMSIGTSREKLIWDEETLQGLSIEALREMENDIRNRMVANRDAPGPPISQSRLKMQLEAIERIRGQKILEASRREGLGSAVRMPPVAVEAQRQPTGRQSMTPPDGYMSIGTSPPEGKVFEGELRDLIDFGEGGFYAKPFRDPESGVNVGIGRSLTYNGMSIPNEVIPFLKAQGVSDAEIQKRLAAAGLSANTAYATMTEAQFNTLFPKGITPEQGQEFLDNDIRLFTSQVEFLIGRDVFRGLSNPRKQVLIDMMYTLGSNDFAGFKRMIGAIEAGDFDKAADEMKWQNSETKQAHTDWYKQVGPRRAEPLIAAMRSGWRLGDVKSKVRPEVSDTSETPMNTIPTVLQEMLPKETQDQIKETAKTPPTQQELVEFQAAYQRTYAALTHPNSPFASAVTEPYLFQIWQQVAGTMDDDTLAEILEGINQVMAD